MGKFSNKPSARPSNRVKLSKKHSVERKVATHSKKMRKEGRKMKALGMMKKSKIEFFDY